MTIQLNPTAVRAGWRYAENAAAEVRDARGRTGEAAGHDMGDVTDAVAEAASDLDGALRVVLGIISEHHHNTEACITDFLTTDGNSAGEFHGLAR